MLCNRCKVIELDDSLPGLHEKTLPNGQTVLSCERGEFELEFKHHDSFPDLPSLQESARAGCGFCSQLIEGLREQSAYILRDDALSVDIYIPYAFYSWGLSDLLKNTDSHYTGLSRLAIYIRRAHVADINVAAVTFDVVAEEDSFASRYLQIRRRPLSEPLSAQAVASFKSWTDNCYNSHEPCKRDVFVPTRLIDVGNENSPARLIMTSKDDRFAGVQTPGYLALSYCWGISQPSSPPFKTEWHSLASRMDAINGDEVPQTLADSFIVARALGYRFVWIDALCIIQDDKADWEREALVMRSIYGSARITIVAAWSRSSHDGFIARKKPRLFPMKVSPHNGQSENFFLQNRHDPYGVSEYTANITSGEWATRGWTFQEKLGSQCLLYFGRDMVHYCCQCDVRAENTKEVAVASGASVDTIQWSSYVEQNRLEAWFDAIMEYSGRKLTYPSDKLPAVSALALDVSKATSTRYLAGLWEEDIVWALLWECQPRVYGPLRIHLTRAGTRAGTYRAPSWSWAAGDGVINWSRPLKPLDSFPQELVTVLKAETVVSGGNPFGSVNDGSITLAGKLKHMHLPKSTASAQYADGDIAAIPRPITNEGQLKDHSDINLDWGSPPDVIHRIHGSGVWLLPLVTYLEFRITNDPDKYTPTYTGLILFDTNPGRGDLRTFQRVGLFRIYNNLGSQLFQDVPEETIVLV